MTLSSELTSVHESLLPRADAAQGGVVHPTLTRHVAGQLHIKSCVHRYASMFYTLAATGLLPAL
jgi:hypothetical protein